MLLFSSAYTVPLDPHIVYYLHIYNTSVVLTTDKPRLFTVFIWLHHILRQQYGCTLRLLHLPTQRWSQFIDIHTTAILFIVSKSYSRHNKVIFYYIPSLHFLKFDIGQCLINTVIIVTYFVWGQHSVFVVAIVTCESAISKLRTLLFRVCHWY